MISKFIASISLCLFVVTAVSAQNPKDSINRLDQEGRKQGYWKKYDDNGMIVYEGHFDGDVPTGEFKYFYPDGTTKAISVFSQHGRRTETTTYHYTGKVMSEGFYIDQQKDSTWKYYNMNGILLKEEFYRNNQKNGTWRSYYEDGNVAEEITWKNDVKNGPWIQYFPDGKRKLEGNYQDDSQHGSIIHYYPSGRARITGEYNNSLRTGSWYYMNDSSKVVKIETYEEGKKVREEEFEPGE